jgi:hypothetical protein
MTKKRKNSIEKESVYHMNLDLENKKGFYKSPTVLLLKATPLFIPATITKCLK